MPLLRALPVMLSAGERTTLKKRVRGAKTTWRDRLRAQIVLAAARGHPNARIAAGLGISVDTVRKWRGRFAGRGLGGLTDRPRPGTGCRAGSPGAGRPDVGIIGAADPGRAPRQAMAVPVVDLSPRPGLR